MEKEFKELKFHTFKISADKSQISQQQHDKPEFLELDGISCLQCKENCPGFKQHKWRLSCKNCRCQVWKHDVPTSFVEPPFERMGIEETVPALESEYAKAATDGYMWYPRGLLESQVITYMKSFPVEKVPKANTAGASYRSRQVIFQLPKQNFKIEHTHFLNDNKSRNSFHKLKKRQLNEALGVGAVRGAVSSTFPCSTCFSTINAGDPAIFAERFGEQFAWHPQCFNCCVDNEALVDLIYFCWERRLYCGRHWCEQFKPHCAGCEELIYVGEYTKAMGKAWHVDHFCCWECDGVLTGSKYIIINEHPFCQKCYNTIVASKCCLCSEPIHPESKDLFVNSQHYHDSCLVCSKCNSTLESQTFSFMDERSPVCHPCRGINMDEIRNCSGCSKPFTSDERKIGANNEYFHEKCFACSQCHQSIGLFKFVRKSDGRKLCDNCFKSTAKVCVKCKDFIKGPTVRFDCSCYHAKCFACTECTKQLGGLQFYKYKDGPCCQECYLLSYAKRCAGCEKPIEGSTKYVDYDMKYWHSKCFCCFSCENLQVVSFLQEMDSVTV